MQNNSELDSILNLEKEEEEGKEEKEKKEEGEEEEEEKEEGEKEEEEEEEEEEKEDEDILRKIEELLSQENNTSLDLGSHELPRILDILKKAYEASPKLQKLTYLNLEDNLLSGSDLIQLLKLLKLFPNLVTLNLDWNDFSNVYYIRDSICCSKDQTLDLKNLSIHGCYINIICSTSYNIINFLKYFPDLVSLHLGDNGLDDKWIEKLAPVLEQCRDLAQLNLNSNDIGPEGSKILANVLQGINFSRLYLFGNNIGAEGAMYIAQVLVQCPNFVELKLNMNNIGDKGVSYITQVLRQCSKLAVIDLGSNNIGIEGALKIAKVLAQCPNLTYLNLTNNNIRDKGALYIAEVLLDCPILTDLNLSYNNITDEGAKSLKEKLSQCHNLVLNKLLLEYQLPA